MTDDTTIHTVRLRGYRFDSTDGPYKATIQTNAVGGVCVRITAPAGARGGAFIIDFADVEPFCNALRAAALEAGERLIETHADMAVTYAIEGARARA